MSTIGKKRKAGDADNGGTSRISGSNKKAATGTFENVVPMYSLQEIQEKIHGLCKRVPELPEDNFKGDNSDDIKEDAVGDWAAQLQAVLEEFNLVVCCVSTATYKWGTDRSGAADQNLSLLTAEIAASQDQIASAVTPRLTNVLAPVVDLVIEKTVKSTDESGKETKENHFTRKLVDPDFVVLCHNILVRNAPLLRHVVLSNFQKILQVINDYLEAHKNDAQHSRGFTY